MENYKKIILILAVISTIVAIIALYQNQNGGSQTSQMILNINFGTQTIYDNTFINTPNFEYDVTQIEDCVTEEIGNTYRNCELGFEISRPNLDWKFNHDLEDEIKSGNFQVPLEIYEGGILLERTTGEYVVVGITSHPNGVDLVKSVEDDLNKFQSIAKYADFKFFITEDGKLLELEMYLVTLDDQSQLFEIRAENKDNKMYSLASIIYTPERVPEKIKNEITEIRNSFVYIN